MPTDRLYFRQLLCGRDVAVGDQAAAQMANQVYLIGDRATGEAVVVDPAWAPAELVDLVTADGMRLVGALVTHHHADHVGGSFGGMRVAGLGEMLAVADVPVHTHEAEARWVARSSGVSETGLVAHADGDTIMVGAIPIEVLHTPGHTPGSQCFLVDGRLVAGDTLFLEGCGRTDLPGSDPAAMYASLRRLDALPDSTVVFPGHRYSMASMGTVEAVRSVNAVLKPATREAWLSQFG